MPHAPRHSLIRRLLYSLRRYGLFRTLALVLKNLRPRTRDASAFDARYGVDTSEFVPVSDLDVDPSRLTEAVGYEPTSPEAFMSMMAMLPIDFSQFTFVDIGAGKGRVLILASELGFGEVVGVEFSPALCEVAKRNAGSRPITVVCCDAREYEFPHRPLVLYMFNPFDAPVMKVLADRIAASIASHPREVWVQYHYPHHRDLFLPQFTVAAEGWNCCTLHCAAPRQSLPT